MDPTKHRDFKKRGGIDGAYIGSLYELKTIFFFMIRACLQEVKFKLFSNVHGCGHVIAECKFKDNTKENYILQAEHLTSNNIKCINKNLLIGTVATSKGKKQKLCKYFQLSKYYDEILNEKGLIPKYSDYKLVFFTNIGIQSPNSEVKWCDEQCDENLCELFNTRDDNDCVKHFNIEENEEILESIGGDKEFLKKICILSNQVSVEGFDEIIKMKLIKLIGNHNTNLINSVFLNLCEKIELCFKINKDDHSKKQTDKTITKDQVKCNEDIPVPYYNNSKFLDDIVASAKTQLTCLAIEKKLKKHFDNYKLSNLQLCAALNANSNNSLLTINSGHTYTLLAMLEVYQIINDRSKDNTSALNNHLFVKLKDLGKVLNLFKYCTALIIIDCKEHDPCVDAYVEHVTEIEKFLKENKEKKAVFILSNNVKDIALKSSVTVDNLFKFNSLSDVTQDYLLDRNIEFQGNNVKLKDLVNKDDINYIIDCETVVKLLKNKSVIVGEKLEELNKETAVCYIERSFYNTQHVVSNDILELKDFTDILFVTVTQQSDLGKHQDKFVKYENIDQNTITCKFYQLRESREENKKAFARIASKFSDKNVHWLEARDNVYVWLETKGSVKFFKIFVNTKEEPKNFESVIKNANQVNIIFDAAGMGKTTVLIKIAEKLKQENPTCWILHYDCNPQKTGQMLHEINNEWSARELLTHLVPNQTIFEQELLVNFLNKGKVIFCFDGFDEMINCCQENFMAMVNKLIESGAKQVWITSREDMESTLQEYLPSFPLKLLPINIENQIKFCINFFHFQLGQPNKETITTFSKFLIESIESVNKSTQEMIGIPMLTRMIASINLENCRKYCNTTAKEAQTTEQFKNLFDMYKKFFKLSIARYLTEKQQILITTKSYEILITDQRHQRLHMYYAAIFLLENKFKNIVELLKLNISNINGSLDLLSIGIITSISEYNAKFLHFSFAEYFFACFISDKLFLSSTNKHDIQSLLDEVFRENRWKNVRKFINYSKITHTHQYDPFYNVNGEQITSLHIAAREGCCSIAEFIIKCVQNKEDIKHWLNLGAYNISGYNCDICYTALHIAAKHGHENIIELLLKYGADIEVKTKKRNTSLIIAAQEGNVEMVRLLLDRGADIKNKNHRGITALVSAARHGKIEIVRLLLERGADVNHETKNGYTALTSSSINGNVEMVKLLITYGANVNHNINVVDTPMSVVKYDDFESGKLQQSHGASVETKVSKTMLMLTARNKHHDVLTYLLRNRKYNIRDTDNNGQTVLHWAALCGRCLNVKSLLDAAADINCQDNQGDTPLHVACVGYCTLQCVQYLVQRGADRNIKNSEGQTASDVCGHSETKKWLQENLVTKHFVNETDLTNNPRW